MPKTESFQAAQNTTIVGVTRGMGHTPTTKISSNQPYTSMVMASTMGGTLPNASRATGILPGHQPPSTGKGRSEEIPRCFTCSIAEQIPTRLALVRD